MLRAKHLLIGAFSVLALSSLAISKAHAEYIAYIYQDGSNVDVSGSGKIDTTDLVNEHIIDGSSADPGIEANIAYFDVAQPVSEDLYTGFSGPTTFGSGTFSAPSSANGSFLGLEGYFSELAVPRNYTSDTLLSGETVFDGETLASLGLTAGTYTWNWGSGVDADSVVLHIGADPMAVPEPASLAVLSAGLVGFGVLRRRRKAA